MIRATFFIANQSELDPDRVDRVVVEAGAVLQDTQGARRWPTTVTVSAWVGLEVIDNEGRLWRLVPVDDAEESDREDATPAPAPRFDLSPVPVASPPSSIEEAVELSNTPPGLPDFGTPDGSFLPAASEPEPSLTVTARRFSAFPRNPLFPDSDEPADV